MRTSIIRLASDLSPDNSFIDVVITTENREILLKYQDSMAVAISYDSNDSNYPKI